MARRILISVTDKTGIEKFRKLVDLGWEVISTGGTAKRLTELGIPHMLIEDVTGFPEMMGGRLKTLHPKVFGGILADREESAHLAACQEHGIKLIDLVAVNLYDFEGNPGIEQIDIGGPSLLRAAAKNGRFVTVLSHPNDYDAVINEIIEMGDTSPELRQRLAMEVFEYTHEYDGDIEEWMREKAHAGNSIFEKQAAATH